MGLPVILPLIALFANRQRERVSLQEAIARATAEAMQQAQVLQRLESKLGALEGSVLSAGSLAREAAVTAAEAGSSLLGDARQQLEETSLRVARELRGELQRGSSDTLRALSQIQPRLQAMEGAMIGLQEAQVESMRRLTAGLTDAIGEAQLTLQAAVRAEAYTSLEPVRRLPQVLAAALPVTDVTIAGMAQARPLECALSSGERDWLQSTLKQQLEAASEQIIASQAQELVTLKTARPAANESASDIRSSLAPQLARINRGLQELTAFQADVGGRMDNRAVLQRLDILQGSFEAAVKPSAQRGNGQRGISPAADPQLMTTVEGLKQSVASLLDQVKEGREASLDLVEETAALREQLQSMQPPSPQEEAGVEAVQEAVMALARAVQQLETRSLSRLDDLGAQLRPSAAPEYGLADSVSSRTGAPQQESSSKETAWAASMDQAAAVSSRLAQQGLGSELPSISPPRPFLASWQDQSPASAAASSHDVDAQAAPRNVAAGVSQEQAFSQMQALLAAQNNIGAAGEIGVRPSEGIQDGDPEGKPRGHPAATSRVGDQDGASQLESSSAEMGSSAAADQLESSTPGDVNPGGASSQQQQLVPSANQRDFSAWLDGSTSSSSPLLVDELRFAAGLAGGAGDSADLPSRPQQAAASNRAPTASSLDALGEADGYFMGGKGISTGTSSEPNRSSHEPAPPALEKAPAAGTSGDQAPPATAPSARGYPVSQGRQNGARSLDAPSIGDQSQGPLNGASWETSTSERYPPQGQQGGAAVGARANVAEGKRLLAVGRAKRREGVAWGEADQALAGACSCFQGAARANPASASILGNWGNALMEYGQLKAAYRDQVRGTGKETGEQRQALRGASENLRVEATDLLRLAGRRYKQAFEIAEGADRRHDSNRALQNWIQSIILRAGLAASSEEAQRLYQNACEKAMALLEDETENAAAWEASGQALLQLGLLMVPTQPSAAHDAWQEAEMCLQRASELKPDQQAVLTQLQLLQDLQRRTPGSQDYQTPAFAALR
ncbi:hypothetical protein WJX84_006308 [Apatococcus fuscideae]|uniref:Uncharacterized protein n=1 Tax=Apatococcus fuscideae TaxID=2026836 RepID=A0AAW1SN94_9CHLO